MSPYKVGASRVPHRGRHGTKAGTLNLLRELAQDERFRCLNSRARDVLYTGVLLHADADGCWQVRRAMWAEECGWKCGGQTSPPGWIGEAIRAAKGCGLLRVQAYIRPQVRVSLVRARPSTTLTRLWLQGRLNPADLGRRLIPARPQARSNPDSPQAQRLAAHLNEVLTRY